MLMNKFVYLLYSLFIFLLLFLVHYAHASDSARVNFSFNKERLNEKEVRFTIRAIMSPNVKLFGLQSRENDVLFSSIEFDSAIRQYLNGDVVEKGSQHNDKDVSVNKVVNYFTDSVLWQQELNAKSTDSFQVKGVVSYLYKDG